MSLKCHRRAVLGLCSGTHDSAAALIVDGELIGFVEEERLSGDEHTLDYPHLSVEWLLSRAHCLPADITTVAYNFAGHRYLSAIPGSLKYIMRRPTRIR